MGKQAQYFAKIEKYKNRFRQLPTTVLRDRLLRGSLYKEAAGALRQLIEEREGAGEDLDGHGSSD